jgi:hypothetical protein
MHEQITRENTPTWLDVSDYAKELGTYSPTKPFQAMWDDLTPRQQSTLIKRIANNGHAKVNQ